jgi:hypothetical protein
MGFNDASWAAEACDEAYGVQPWGTSVNVQDSLGEHPALMLSMDVAVSKQVRSFSRTLSLSHSSVNPLRSSPPRTCTTPRVGTRASR